MHGRLAPLLAGLFLATVTAGAAAQAPGHAGAATTAAKAAKAPAVARGGHVPQPSIGRLQQAVSAAEARRQEIQRRLSEQDREIQALRRQLQGTGNPESTRLH
jgi:hypothetical protein